MRALPFARGGIVASTVASPAPISSSSAVATSRCTYSESQFTIVRVSTSQKSISGLQFFRSFVHLFQLDSPFFQRRLQPVNYFFRRPAAKRFISQLPFLRSNILHQPFAL